jgi:aspartate/methionine/tyrosine aminotransferase
VKEGRLDLDSIVPTDISRALVLWTNSPSNPTGRLDDLGAAAAWGRQHGVLVASDECYVEYTWEGPPRTILEHGSDGVLAVHSISKRSNLAGARAGFFAGDGEVVDFLRAVRQHAGFMVPAPIQAAVAVAYGDDAHVDHQREVYLRRLKRTSTALAAAGYDAPLPQGTFYLWISRPGHDGWSLANELVERAGLLVSPGEFYGDDTVHARLAVVATDERLDLALDRLH